jgi:hypothetical protein
MSARITFSTCASCSQPVKSTAGCPQIMPSQPLDVPIVSWRQVIKQHALRFVKVIPAEPCVDAHALHEPVARLLRFFKLL